MAIVYHPSSPKLGNTWMNIGFMGWIGILSGVNEHKMGVSEIGVSYPDETFGK
jgi:exportin-7